MKSLKWYDDPEELKRRLADHNGNITDLGRSYGVSPSTIRNAMTRHGVERPTPAPTDEPSQEAALAKANEVLRLENKRLRKYANDTATGDTAAERVIQRIESAVADQRPEWEPLDAAPSSTGKRTEQELVLEWSDLHAAEVVSLEETRGINEYNWQVMEERMRLTQTAIFSHSQHFGFNISRLQIAMLGDMLSGDIHEELAITNDRPLAEAVVDLAYAHVPWLLGFAEEFPEIVISGVPGNHPRATKKPAAKMAHNNADWLFYKVLEALLKGHPQFTFQIDKGAFQVITIADRWRALLMHGDGIRSTMPGVPWGGVARRITALEAQFVQARQPLDYVFLGHFHTRNAIDGVGTQTYMNGSVKGPDEYSLKMFGSGRPASQTLMSFHPRRGWTGSYAIELQGTRPGSEGW